MEAEKTAQVMRLRRERSNLPQNAHSLPCTGSLYQIPNLVCIFHQSLSTVLNIDLLGLRWRRGFIRTMQHFVSDAKPAWRISACDTVNVRWVGE